MLKFKNKLLIIFTLFSFSLVLSSPTLAVNSDNSSAKTPEEIEAYKQQLRDQKETNKNEYADSVQERKQEVRQNVEERKEQVQEKREERQGQLCENVVDKIQKRLSNYETNKDTHVEKYQNLVDRLYGIADDLEEQDYDVSELRAAIVELEAMIDDYVSAYDAFILELGQTEDYACGESDGDFRQALQDANQQLKSVREKRREIVEYYVTSIRDEIKGLREQARERANSSEEVSNE